ncbi:glb-33 [Pristionchus pacificus]|uniref:Glb-33 n=1 Tax=Pristionchus pacificus TaxID=54126 RepID=A0A2A6C9Z7_PRIPA|nr:glb-33 [Pristionchus pacificus]|eukprot:PDM74910.1 glb-33 [Pristionchus pacificus]
MKTDLIECRLPSPNATVLPYEAQIFRKFELVVTGYMSVLCVILGTIGNLYGVRSVHITNFDKNRGVVLAVSVLALAFWDTALLWCAFFYYAIKVVDPWPSQSQHLNMITPCFHAFSQIANTASIWCVVAITSQRFMATRDPFRCQRSAALLQSFRERRTSSISFYACYANRRLLGIPMLISFFAIVVNLPAFFEISIAYCWKMMEGVRVVQSQLRVTELRTHPTYSLFYRTIFRMLITNIGPNFLIVFLTVWTIIILRGSNRSRMQLFRMTDNLLDRYSSREMMQTMISIILVTKFLLFRSLAFMLDIVEVAFNDEIKHHYYKFMMTVSISNFFILLNSATNCIIFLKASTWLNDKISERKTMKRKKTVTDSSQAFNRDRYIVLNSTWEQAKKLTNDQIGYTVLYSMIRKQPSLLDPLRPPSFAPGGETHIVTLIGLPVKRSFDFMAQAKYQEIANRITSFIEELLKMMLDGAPDTCLQMRIRRAGAIHHSRNIKISSTVWKEFKACLLGIIGELDYDSPKASLSLKRDMALEVWSSFISFIIREMKLGVFACDSFGPVSVGS